MGIRHSEVRMNNAGEYLKTIYTHVNNVEHFNDTIDFKCDTQKIILKTCTLSIKAGKSRRYGRFKFFKQDINELVTKFLLMIECKPFKSYENRRFMYLLVDKKVIHKALGEIHGMDKKLSINQILNEM